MKYAISLYEDLAKKPQYFQTIINAAFDNRYDSVLWKKFFTWDIMPSLDDQYKSIEVVDSGVIMADIVSRFSDGSQRDGDGYKFYQGTIPALAHKYQDRPADLVRLQRLQQTMNGNSAVIQNFVKDIAKYADGIHSRITNMAMQLLSTGKIEGAAGTGLSYLSKTPIPTSNFRKALTAVWTDATNATPIADMVEHEKYVRDTLGYTGELEWNINRATLLNLLKNKEVKEYVLPVLVSAGLAILPNGMVTENAFMDFVSNGNLISRVVVVDEKQREASMTGVTTVSGWKSGAAVLRPAGFAGVVKYSELPEYSIVQGESGIQVAYLEGGRVGIKRKFSQESETWETSVKAAAIPALSAFTFHVIVDTLSV